MNSSQKLARSVDFNICIQFGATYIFFTKMYFFDRMKIFELNHIKR